MDVLTFIAKLVSSLVWPSTALIVVFVLIRHAKSLAGLFKSVKYKDWEFTLRDDFRVAEELSYRVGTVTSLGVTRPPENELVELATIDSGLAVLKSWKKLEIKVTQLIQHNGLIRFTNPLKFMNLLLDRGKIARDDLQLFEKLMKIRNDAVHGMNGSPRLNIAEVVEYDGLVNVLVERLDDLSKGAGYIDTPADGH